MHLILETYSWCSFNFWDDLDRNIDIRYQKWWTKTLSLTYELQMHLYWQLSRSANINCMFTNNKNVEKSCNLIFITLRCIRISHFYTKWNAFFCKLKKVTWLKQLSQFLKNMSKDAFDASGAPLTAIWKSSKFYWNVIKYFTDVCTNH